MVWIWPWDSPAVKIQKLEQKYLGAQKVSTTERAKIEARLINAGNNLLNNVYRPLNSASSARAAHFEGRERKGQQRISIEVRTQQVNDTKNALKAALKAKDFTAARQHLDNLRALREDRAERRREYFRDHNLLAKTGRGLANIGRGMSWTGRQAKEGWLGLNRAAGDVRNAASNIKQGVDHNIFGAATGHGASRFNYIAFFIMAFAVHIVDWSYGFGGLDNMRIFLHLSMAVLTWIFIFWDSKNMTATLKSLIMLIGVAMVAYYFPQLGLFLRAKIPSLTALHALDIILNPIIHPLWVYFGVIAFKDKDETASMLLVWIVIFWTFYLLFAFTAGPNINDSHYTQSRLTQKEYDTLWEVYTRFAKGLELWTKKILIEIPQKVEEEWQKQIAIATGDYYVGQVDAAAKAPLGISIHKVSPGEPYYSEGDPVTMWATISAFSTGDAIPVIVQCSRGSDFTKSEDLGLVDYEVGYVPPGSENSPSIRPNMTEDVFYLENFEKTDVSCTFNNQTGYLPRGKTSVFFDVQFPFKTIAYQKVYFMDIEKKRALQAENLDPLAVYGIVDKEPTTVYSQGPLMIGIGTTNPIFGVNLLRWVNEGAEWKINPSIWGYTPIDTTVNPRDKAFFYGCYGEQYLADMQGLSDNVVLPVAQATGLAAPGEYETVNLKNQDLCEKLKNIQPSRSALRITIDNTWDKGRVKEIKQMFVYIPKGAYLYGCPEFVLTDPNLMQNEEDKTAYDLYKLRPDLKIKLDKSTGYRTFRCFLDQTPGVLGTAPITTRFIRAEAWYDYELKSSGEVTIMRALGGSEEGTETDNYPTFIGEMCTDEECTARKPTECNDRGLYVDPKAADNDNDGFIDWGPTDDDQRDRECTSRNDNSEKSGAKPTTITEKDRECDVTCQDPNGCLVPRKCNVHGLLDGSYIYIPQYANGYGDVTPWEMRASGTCPDRDGCICNKVNITYGEDCTVGEPTSSAPETPASSSSSSSSSKPPSQPATPSGEQTATDLAKKAYWTWRDNSYPTSQKDGVVTAITNAVIIDMGNKNPTQDDLKSFAKEQIGVTEAEIPKLFQT